MVISEFTCDEEMPIFFLVYENQKKGKDISIADCNEWLWYILLRQLHNSLFMSFDQGFLEVLEY